MARSRNGAGSIAGCPAEQAARARPLLGHGLRLAQGRGQAERSAAVHHRDRRARHPLHPRPLAPPGRAAADRDPRLAGVGPRTAEGDRPADRPDGTRRSGPGRVPSRHPVAARLRLLGAAAGARLGPRPDRPRLGRADEAPGIHPLRRARRRLGGGRHRGDGSAGTGRIDRHPRQPGRRRYRPTWKRRSPAPDQCRRCPSRNEPCSTRWAPTARAGTRATSWR